LSNPSNKPIGPLEYPIHELQVLARLQRDLLSADPLDRDKALIVAKVIEEKLAKMRGAWNQALAKKAATRVHGTPDQIM